MSGLFDGPLVFVDVETTGGNPARSRIIEIALVGACGSQLEFEWSTLVNPGEPIPPSIQHFTGITDEMVRHAPFFEDVHAQIGERLADRLFVAHNARFDYGFVRQEFRRLGQKFTARPACTVKLSRRLYPEVSHHNLDAIIERHQLDITSRHRAMPDAQALWQFWSTLRRTRPLEELNRALRDCAQLPSLPPHLPPDLPDRLPESPGVYRFYGEDDALLYIGKARDIRQRVLSHWQTATAETRSQRLARLTQRVEWTCTAGELGALLLEARLVRELKPLYNRRLRGHAQSFVWLVGDDGGAPELSPLDQLQLHFEAADAYGPYRTESAARRELLAIARDHQLCLKMIGLEAGAGSCFARQLGRCRGACIGLEPLPLHGARVKLALAGAAFKRWPYPGAVAIRERDGEDFEEVHVIEDWRHVATLDAHGQDPREQEPDEQNYEQRFRAPFDIDVYRILLRALRGDARRRVIRLPGAAANAA